MKTDFAIIRHLFRRNVSHPVGKLL